MKNLLMLAILFTISTASHAAYQPVSEEQRPIYIQKVQHAIMKKIENGRPQNCFMPYDHGFGVLFENNGLLLSREFLFTSNEGLLLDLPTYYDASLNTIMLQQSGSLFGQTLYSLIVTFSEDGTATDIELKFNYQSTNIAVKCDQY